MSPKILQVRAAEGSRGFRPIGPPHGNPNFLYQWILCLFGKYLHKAYCALGPTLNTWQIWAPLFLHKKGTVTICILQMKKMCTVSQGKARIETPPGQLHICSGYGGRDGHSWGQWPSQEQKSKKQDVQHTSTSVLHHRARVNQISLSFWGIFSFPTWPSLSAQPAARRHKVQGHRGWGGVSNILFCS